MDEYAKFMRLLLDIEGVDWSDARKEFVAQERKAYEAWLRDEHSKYMQANDTMLGFYSISEEQE